MEVNLNVLIEVFVAAAPWAALVALVMSFLVKPFLTAIPNWNEWRWNASVVNFVTAALSYGICWWQAGDPETAIIPAIVAFAISVAGYEGIKNVLSGIGLDITNVWRIK